MRHRFAPRERRGELRAGGGALYSIATLARAPEEPRHRRVVADHRLAVGREGAQPRPAVPDAPKLDVEDAFDALDGQRDGQIIRIRIPRREGFLVRRRDQKTRRIGLEVELFIDIEYRGPATDLYAARGIDERRSPAQRPEPQRCRATGGGELIRPRACGIDEDGCAKAFALYVHLPTRTVAPRGATTGADVHSHAERLGLAQIALQERGDIDVMRVRLVEARRRITGPQARDHGT